MKKNEARNEILYVRISKSTKDFITKSALKVLGTKRKESPFINLVLEELRDYGRVSLNESRDKVSN